ncbi:hypothetical protein HC766_06645 [Candidatus Gracilibacteria bacterium]|nr:hypothetical protein [Candidatus Gracilibacteria bacterium]
MIFALIGVSLTFTTFSNQGMAEVIFNNYSAATINTDEINNCSVNSSIEGLEQSNDKNLKALDDFQNVCNSFVADRLMIFTEMPIDSASSEYLAQSLGAKLQEFAQYKVEPVVIVEPVNSGQLLNYEDIKNGRYDGFFENFFAELSELDLTDEQMGIWVPFPESNVPYWDHGETLPSDYAINVNKYLGYLKKYFPNSEGSILLNSITYDPEDENWENGDYVSLVPYTMGLNPDLVDSVGIQGFPWVSKASSKNRKLFDAQDFLSTSFIIESAKLLRTKDIWINTGTFSRKYTDSSIDEVRIGLDQRKTLLDDILVEVFKAEEDGYRIWVNLFAEDKSETTEATDWSYLESEGGKVIFKEFVQQLNDNEVELALFDIRKD